MSPGGWAKRLLRVAVSSHQRSSWAEKNGKIVRASRWDKLFRVSARPSRRRADGADRWVDLSSRWSGPTVATMLRQRKSSAPGSTRAAANWGGLRLPAAASRSNHGSNLPKKMGTLSPPPRAHVLNPRSTLLTLLTHHFTGTTQVATQSRRARRRRCPRT